MLKDYITQRLADYNVTYHSELAPEHATEVFGFKLVLEEILRRVNESKTKIIETASNTDWKAGVHLVTQLQQRLMDIEAEVKKL